MLVSANVFYMECEFNLFLDIPFSSKQADIQHVIWGIFVISFAFVLTTYPNILNNITFILISYTYTLCLNWTY